MNEANCKPTDFQIFPSSARSYVLDVPGFSQLAACCFAGPASAAVSENTAREAFEAITKRFESAYNAGSPAGIADLFATGGVYLTPSGTMLKTRQEIETAVGGRIKAGWTKETVTVIDAHPAGDDVWGIGEYTIAGTGQNSGKQIGGNFAVVLTHEGSDWRFRLLIGNLKPTQDVTGITPRQRGSRGRR